MKALKIIGMIVGTIIALVLVLHFIAPADFHTELSMTIDAPKELVFNNVKYWQKWHAWSPWVEQDPSMGYIMSQRLLVIMKKRYDIRTEQFIKTITHHPDIAELL